MVRVLRAGVRRYARMEGPAVVFVGRCPPGWPEALTWASVLVFGGTCVVAPYAGMMGRLPGGFRRAVLYSGLKALLRAAARLRRLLPGERVCSVHINEKPYTTVLNTEPLDPYTALKTVDAGRRIVEVREGPDLIAFTLC